MPKRTDTGIREQHLDQSLYALHKDPSQKTDFGLDNSRELIENGFGLYSTANLKSRIGPVKTEYFRIALVMSGTARIDVGLETYHPKRNWIVVGFPGQVFALTEPKDFYTYYILFTQDFMKDTTLLKKGMRQFPFFSYEGIHSFELGEEEARKIEGLVMNMNEEVKKRKTDFAQTLRLSIQLILVHISRSYARVILQEPRVPGSEDVLFTRFVKLVSQHFKTLHKVSDYAKLLHVSPDHLNRTIKVQSHKTAHELIDEMIVMEAKAHLRHSAHSIAEIAYMLDFADPSHFNRFFKKYVKCTPLQFRNASE